MQEQKKEKLIVIKYNQIGRKKRNSFGESTAETIAKQYNLKERQIYNYYKLNNLIKEFMERIDMGTLSINSGLKLASIDSKLQKNIYDNYNDVLDNKRINNLNLKVDKEAVISQLESENETYNFVPVTVKVPVGFEDEFRIYIDMWLK